MGWVSNNAKRSKTTSPTKKTSEENYFRFTGRDADDVTENGRLFNARAAATERA